MDNHYKTLGLTNAASSDEIRRAYRILARRYHPDVNPNGDTEALFKEIAQAYSVLSDPEKKQQYDLDLKQSLESFDETFERAQEALKRNRSTRAYIKQKRTQHAQTSRKGPASTHRPAQTSRQTSAKPVSTNPKQSELYSLQLEQLRKIPTIALAGLQRAIQRVRSRNIAGTKAEQDNGAAIAQLAIIEISVSMQDAIQGVKKTVEVSGADSDTRKVSVNIPPGVTTGSLVRLRNKERENEEIVLIIRVENHPWLSLSERGITMEVPLTIGEAVDGGKVQVPSFGDPLLVTVEPGTQSGKEVRLKNQGLFHRDGTRGDLYLRFNVRIPDAPLPAEISNISEMLAESYTHDIRGHLPKRLGE